MKTIWKFSVGVDDDVVVSMPVGAVALSVQLQHGQAVMWAIVNDDAPVERRRFHWRGTGHLLGDVGRFIGTVQMGPLVFHLFEAA